MTQQFYVSPEQLMKDRADFARKGIARGRSVVVISCEDGIALVAENPSPSLHKIGEIYDKIAFAAVGKYNEFESLRQAGVRYADVRGYSYDREDVTARGLASVYAQSLGAVFTAEQKPFEVELAVAEVGATQAEDHLYRLTFDGSIADEHSFVVMGGQADKVSSVIGQGWRGSLNFADAVRLAINGLVPPAEAEEQAKSLPAGALEVAVLDRQSETMRGSRRAFRRLNDADITALLA
ncbi:proteasome subunit alpha [Pseudarthrobacter polychromogenes]|uniref:Proteasome subunit alpha n=1 Tax=Pseudarthrobacter polychromogenes TaxID=1676 RepID=A0ABQ1XCR5_9MICC|nr:proteasome subunit alpha [Pseudarthrobacter polychromogenes]GGG86052.1 proteasome subunit alpha [Pseudarthrobacter polychromogenes]